MGREGVRTHPCGMDVLQGVHFSVVSRRVLLRRVVSRRVALRPQVSPSGATRG